MYRWLFIFLIFAAMVLPETGKAQVQIYGDARLRPRYDIKDYGKFGHKISDIYYNYRARLNVHADIGEGWYFHTMLGTNGVAFWTGTFGEGNKPSSQSVEGTGRGTVDFIYLYVGRENHVWGFKFGALPLNSLKNPLLDIHYYPEMMVDIPFFIYSNMGGQGAGGYYKVWDGKLSAHVLVDNNMGYQKKDFSGLEIHDSRDQYMTMLDYIFDYQNYSIQPVVMMTFAGDSVAKPLTMGVNTVSPEFSGFVFSNTIGYSMQHAGNTLQYNAWFVRLKTDKKFGKSRIQLWYDRARKSVTSAETDYVYNFHYIWLSYAHTLFSGERGEIYIRPTYRYLINKIDNMQDYSRHKLELVINMSFK